MEPYRRFLEGVNSHLKKIRMEVPYFLICNLHQAQFQLCLADIGRARGDGITIFRTSY